MQKDQGVDDDGPELNKEDPDVVKSKTLAFVILGGPAPGTGPDKVFLAIDQRTNGGEKQGEEPGQTDHYSKDVVTDPPSFYSTDEGVSGDEEDKETRGDVSDVDEPALGEARTTRGENGIFPDPVP